MSQSPNLSSMRNFLTIWAGQLVSTIGSSMSSFAIAIWAWEITGKATTLTLVGFFSLLPSIAIACCFEAPDGRELTVEASSQE